VARQAARIVISGRTDSTGEAQANNRLALSRAIATRNFLRQQIPGVDNVIVIDAKGSCCFVADNATPQGRARNRRVDVAFALQG
jgi:outer membrane protein OmpA-like peptidoglycan-associated protein